MTVADAAPASPGGDAAMDRFCEELLKLLHVSTSRSLQLGLLLEGSDPGLGEIRRAWHEATGGAKGQGDLMEVLTDRPHLFKITWSGSLPRLTLSPLQNFYRRATEFLRAKGSVRMDALTSPTTLGADEVVAAWRMSTPRWAEERVLESALRMQADLFVLESRASSKPAAAGATGDADSGMALHVRLRDGTLDAWRPDLTPPDWPEVIVEVKMAECFCGCGHKYPLEGLYDETLCRRRCRRLAAEINSDFKLAAAMN